MREIKFRAWYKGDKYPLDKKHLAESEKPQMLYDVQKLYDGSNVIDKNQVLAGIGSFGGLVVDDDFVIMQYTGLKDKNGVEIYEGDIIEEWEDGRYLWVVKWDEEMACFFIEEQQIGETFYLDDLLGVINNSGSKVIGNIYENPELITA